MMRMSVDVEKCFRKGEGAEDACHLSTLSVQGQGRSFFAKVQLPVSRRAFRASWERY